jgi:hypothetical protein
LGRCDCETLKKVLEGIPGAERMVVGHTIQEQGINSACGDRVFRIDVGMSQGCGDSDPEVRHPPPRPPAVSHTLFPCPVPLAEVQGLSLERLCCKLA